MQGVLKKSVHMEMAVFALAVLAFALFYFAGPAFAGADTTFDTALTKFTDFLEGSGGKIITVLSLAGGIVGSGLGPLLPRPGRDPGRRGRRRRHRHSDRHLHRHRDDLTHRWCRRGGSSAGSRGRWRDVCRQVRDPISSGRS